MPYISNAELQTLRRSAARGGPSPKASPPRALKPTPKAKPIVADPHRAEKLKILANVPATLRAELLKPSVSVATCRAAAKVVAGEALNLDAREPGAKPRLTNRSGKAEEIWRELGIDFEKKPAASVDAQGNLIFSAAAVRREFKARNARR